MSAFTCEFCEKAICMDQRHLKAHRELRRTKETLEGVVNFKNYIRLSAVVNRTINVIGDITPETALYDIHTDTGTIDSLELADLVIAIETEFNIDFPESIFSKNTLVIDVVNMIRELAKDE